MYNPQLKTFLRVADAGNIVIPGSKNPDHIKDNFDIFDFSLTNDEMEAIAEMDKGERYYTST